MITHICIKVWEYSFTVNSSDGIYTINMLNGYLFFCSLMNWLIDENVGTIIYLASLIHESVESCPPTSFFFFKDSVTSFYLLFFCLTSFLFPFLLSFVSSHFESFHYKMILFLHNTLLSLLWHGKVSMEAVASCDNFCITTIFGDIDWVHSWPENFG